MGIETTKFVNQGKWCLVEVASGAGLILSSRDINIIRGFGIKQSYETLRYEERGSVSHVI